MNRLNLIANKRALVIVAHPDDETIWMGGTIRKQADVLWTIFSLCRESDKDREPKFRRVCAYYKAECLIADLDDEGKLDLNEAKEEAKKILTVTLKENNYDYIFTHGTNGEYGHLLHVAVHKAVAELIKEEKLKPEAVFYFDYIKKGSKLISGNKSLTVELTKDEILEKKQVVADMYGYVPDGIDVSYCTNPEAFTRCVVKSKKL